MCSPAHEPCLDHATIRSWDRTGARPDGGWLMLSTDKHDARAEIADPRRGGLSPACVRRNAPIAIREFQHSDGAGAARPRVPNVGPIGCTTFMRF